MGSGRNREEKIRGGHHHRLIVAITGGEDMVEAIGTGIGEGERQPGCHGEVGGGKVTKLNARGLRGR